MAGALAARCGGGRSLSDTTTNKSTSLFSSGWPQAWEPKRMILSGANSVTNRFVISLGGPPGDHFREILLGGSKGQE
jgi:hypothetical protein